MDSYIGDCPRTPGRIDTDGRPTFSRYEVRTGALLCFFGVLTEQYPCREDILALGDDTGYVDIVDIRRGNILHAYEGPGALPNEPSPVTGRVHLWRVVDLEGCRKAHNFPKHHVMRWRDYARHLMAP